MSASTRILVKVVREYEDVVEISAITLADAEEEARQLDGVVRVISSKYA